MLITKKALMTYKMFNARTMLISKYTWKTDNSATANNGVAVKPIKVGITEIQFNLSNV
jgi:hypothetical protein